MSLFAGLRSGLRIGLRSGLNPGGASLAGVTKDATSNIYTPANATEWAAVMSVAGISSGGPSLLWLCQEASGNLADSIGAFTGTLTGGPPSFQQAIAGWSRKGITGADAGTTVFANTAAGLPDPATTSNLILTYSIVTAAGAASRVMADMGTALATSQVLTVTPIIRLDSGSVFDGTNNPTGAVRPYWFQYNVTANASAIYTDQEKITGSKRATTGKRIRLLGGFPGSLLYCAAFFGPAAEMSAAQIKSLSQTLNWTIPWS